MGDAVEPTLCFSCLHLAICRSDGATIAKLLTRGAKVNTTDEKGDSAIHCACAKGLEVSIVDQLLAAKGDLNLGIVTGKKTPLAVAVQKNKPEIVSSLLARGAQVDAWAMYFCKLDAESQAAYRGMLEDNGGDPTKPLATGTTVLHLAAADGQYGPARWACKAGVDVNATDSEGKTALM